MPVQNGACQRNVAIQVRNSKRRPSTPGRGLLFTHRPVRPLILSASAHAGLMAEHYYINLDLKPRTG